MKSHERAFEIDQAELDSDSASEALSITVLDAPRVPAAPNPLDYDRIVVFFSGGKDSVACVLHLLDLGVPAERIELHHHLIDGREGSELMDWPVTEAYCEAFAQAFGMRLNMSWKQGGMEREMLRDNQPTAATMVPVDDPDAPQGRRMVAVGGKGPLNTRRMFPQQAASLSVRWCSSYLKIGVGDAYITHNPKFLAGKTLVVTGERAEESASRARYAAFEPHRTDNRAGKRVQRHVDHWRPVHGWSEHEVWAIIARYRVAPHPAYLLGWGRVSCCCCIFGSASQWASVKAVAPCKFNRIAAYEREFKVTIHRKLNVEELAAKGTPYPMDERTMQLAMSTAYDQPIILDAWSLPAGAFGESCGPT